MFKLNKYFEIFLIMFLAIITSIVFFYFTNHNNLKEHINTKDDHLKDNIS